MKRATASFGPRNKCETNGEEGGKRRKRGTYRRMLQKFIKKNCKYIVYLYTKRAQSQNNRTISIPLNYFRLETGTYLFDRLISVNILSLAALSTTFYFSIYHASKRVIVSIVRHFVRKKRKTFSSRKKKKKKNRQRERERNKEDDDQIVHSTDSILFSDDDSSQFHRGIRVSSRRTRDGKWSEMAGVGHRTPKINALVGTLVVGARQEATL